MPVPKKPTTIWGGKSMHICKLLCSLLLLNMITVCSYSQSITIWTSKMQLTGIQANHKNSGNIINWQVSDVREGTHFYVRRSVNGTDFVTIKSFTELQTQSANTYSYTDNELPADAQQLFYRIEAKEPSGWTLISWLIPVNNKTDHEHAINYTTVQGQSLITSLQVPNKENYTVMIVSANGVLLQKKSVNLEAGINVISLPLNEMAHGSYTLSLMNNGLMDSKRFLY